MVITISIFLTSQSYPHLSPIQLPPLEFYLQQTQQSWRVGNVLNEESACLSMFH